MKMFRRLKEFKEEFVREDIRKYKIFMQDPKRYIFGMGRNALIALIVFILGGFFCMIHSDIYGDTGTTFLLKAAYFIVGYKVLAYIYESSKDGGQDG